MCFAFRDRVCAINCIEISSPTPLACSMRCATWECPLLICRIPLCALADIHSQRAPSLRPFRKAHWMSVFGISPRIICKLVRRSITTTARQRQSARSAISLKWRRRPSKEWSTRTGPLVAHTTGKQVDVSGAIDEKKVHWVNAHAISMTFNWIYFYPSPAFFQSSPQFNNFLSLLHAAAEWKI